MRLGPFASSARAVVGRRSTETLDVEITRLAELAFIMQKAVMAEHMTSVNARLPQLERMVNEYVTTVSGTYNAAPSELPPHPDMETEGRWMPLDE